MNSEIEKITIELFGTSIKIQSNEDPKYISDLIEYIESKATTIIESVKLKDPLKIAVLTSLLLADDYVTLKKATSEFSNEDFSTSSKDPETSSKAEKEVEEITSRLIRQIDQLLINDL